MMAQYGFFFDQSRCFGCHACAVACKVWNELPPGPLKYLKIYEYEKGVFPQVRMYFHWIPCYHCENPVCVAVCPEEAMYKEAEYGAVIIDGDKCIGCRLCYQACPYGAIVFESDADESKARKCDLCFGRLEMGDLPLCVLACDARALDFGPLSTLESRYGTHRDLEDMPHSSTTGPAVVFKPHKAKRPLVSYDSEKAATLLMRRDPFPPFFSSIKDLTEVPEGTVGRSELVLKHASSDELMRYTRNDEG